MQQFGCNCPAGGACRDGLRGSPSRNHPISRVELLWSGDIEVANVKEARRARALRRVQRPVTRLHQHDETAILIDANEYAGDKGVFWTLLQAAQILRRQGVVVRRAGSSTDQVVLFVLARPARRARRVLAVLDDVSRLAHDGVDIDRVASCALPAVVAHASCGGWDATSVRPALGQSLQQACVSPNTLLSTFTVDVHEMSDISRSNLDRISIESRPPHLPPGCTCRAHDIRRCSEDR